jgi:hypothetical protein
MGSQNLVHITITITNKKISILEINHDYRVNKNLDCGTNQDYVRNKILVRGTNHDYKVGKKIQGQQNKS